MANTSLEARELFPELFEQQEERTTEFNRKAAEGISDVQRDELIREHWEKTNQFISNVDKKYSDYQREFYRSIQQAIGQATERSQRRKEDYVLYWGPIFIKCVAAQYLRLLLGSPLHPSCKGSEVSASSYDCFLRFMAKEIGNSMEDTALLCDSVIYAGDEAFEAGSCPGLRIYVDAAQAHDKLTLLMKVHECRTLLEEYSRLAAELPDQVALLVQAQILDELL